MSDPYGLSDLRHAAYDDPVVGPALGFYSTANQVTGSTLRDDVAFGSVLVGPRHYLGKGIVALPNRSGTDREKIAGTLSSATMTIHDSVAYTGTFNNEPWEFIRGGLGKEGPTLDRLNRAAQDALNAVYFDTRVFLTLWDDGDFARADRTSWLGSTTDVNLEISKTTQRAYNQAGYRSLLAVHNVANAYVYHAYGFDCQPGDRLWCAAFPIIGAGGPVTFELWDYRNGSAFAKIGNTITATGKGRLHMGASFSVPNGCYQVRPHLGAAINTTVAWDALPSHDLSAMTFDAPAGFTENWMIHRIEAATYGRSVATGVENTNSASYTSLVPRVDYSLQSYAEDANPGVISLLPPHKTLGAQDISFYGQQRESQRNALTGEGGTTQADWDFTLAAFLSRCCDLLEARDRLGPGGQWMQYKAEQERMLLAQRVVRVEAAFVKEAKRSRLAV